MKYLILLCLVACAKSQDSATSSSSDVLTLKSSEAACQQINLLTKSSTPTILETTNPTIEFLIVDMRMIEIQPGGNYNGSLVDGTIAWGNCDVNAHDGKYLGSSWVTSRPTPSW